MRNECGQRSMTEVYFYHLGLVSLDFALPILLEKTLASEKRALVIGGSRARVESLAISLWSYSPESWLPHGTEKDGDPVNQPIWLSENDENLNNATFLFLTDGMTTDRLGDYERCLELFDGNDPAAVEVARSHWSSYKKAGHSLIYWQQKPMGGWEKKSQHMG